MNFSRGVLAGMAPIYAIAAVVLVIAGGWLLAAGHGPTGFALVIIGALTAAQAAIGYWLRHRHPDPWEPL